MYLYPNHVTPFATQTFANHVTPLLKLLYPAHVTTVPNHVTTVPNHAQYGFAIKSPAIERAAILPKQKPQVSKTMAFMCVKDNVVVACGQGVVTVGVGNSLQSDGVVCPLSMPTRAGQVFTVLKPTKVTLTCAGALNTLSYIGKTIV